MIGLWRSRPESGFADAVLNLGQTDPAAVAVAEQGGPTVPAFECSGDRGQAYMATTDRNLCILASVVKVSRDGDQLPGRIEDAIVATRFEVAPETQARRTTPLSRNSHVSPKPISDITRPFLLTTASERESNQPKPAGIDNVDSFVDINVGVPVMPC